MLLVQIKSNLQWHFWKISFSTPYLWCNKKQNIDTVNFYKGWSISPLIGLWFADRSELSTLISFVEMTEHLNCIRLCGGCVMPQDSQHSNNNKILMSQSTFYQMFYFENWISDTTALVSCCLSVNLRSHNRNTKKCSIFQIS